MSSIRYQIQEGSFHQPPNMQDRSMNNFVFPASGAVSFNISIARDVMLAEETINAYVTRQIALLAKNMPGHKMSARGSAYLGFGQQQIHGEQIDASYKSGKQQVWQRQAAFVIGPSKVLIFSCSSANALTGEQEAVWQDLLHSFVPSSHTF